MSQPHSDNDPLLEFSIEPGAVPVPLPPPSQPVEPIAASVVSVPSPAGAPSADQVEQLRARIDRLEKAFSESSRDLVALKSEVATLVGATADIRKRIGRATAPAIASSSPSPSPSPRPRRRALQAVTALAGIVLGIAAGAWFWLNTGNEPLVPAAPIAIASEPSPPPPPVAAPVNQPVIVPAAAITPVRDAPAHASSPRVEYQPVKYVGTLSIDSDPGGDVFIDRKPMGKTPIRAENLKAGSHLVWIERDGYHRFTRVVLVPADRVSRLFADLEPESR